jgi:3-hydroxyacyl-CoA dehydrogenase
MTVAKPIRTVGVIGLGAVGCSWSTLFLANGLKVLVSDPSPHAKDRLEAFISKEWPAMKKLGLSDGASPSNFEFVDDVANYLHGVDFVQEVTHPDIPSII